MLNKQAQWLKQAGKPGRRGQANLLALACARLDDDVGNAIADGGRCGGVALHHLLSKLHMRGLGLVRLCRLREALNSNPSASAFSLSSWCPDNYLSHHICGVNAGRNAVH